MFTRSLVAGSERYVHAMVRLEFHGGAVPLPQALHASGGLDTLTARPDWTIAKRVVRQADGCVLVLFQVLAPAGDAGDVITCLQTIGGQWRAPSGDAEFDRWLTTAPSQHALLAPARYSAGDIWFACPFRAADLWPRLLAAGTRGSQAVGYQTNLYACRPKLPVLRELTLNRDRVQCKLGVPARLRDLQALLEARARRSRWLVEDLVMLQSSTLADQVQQDVDVLFRGAFDDIGAGPQLGFAEGGLADNLALACGHDEVWSSEPSILAAQAADLEAVLASLDLQADLSAFPLHPAAALPEARAAAHSEPYVFISYAHADRAAMRRVCNWLQQAGIACWVDENLQGGEEWDAVLEDRIRHCALLLVLISAASAQSRFVRRELRFADAMGRRLLCLRLGEATLVEGMAMLLLPLQWIDDGKVATQQQLIEATRHWTDEFRTAELG